jgi:hypothetical protein
MAQVGKKSKFEAGNVRFDVQHELWDGNIDDHSDQGVAILVVGQAQGKETTLLRSGAQLRIWSRECKEALPHGSDGRRQSDRLVGEADQDAAA